MFLMMEKIQKVFSKIYTEFITNTSENNDIILEKEHWTYSIVFFTSSSYSVVAQEIL